jgi:hypothetical protein
MENETETGQKPTDKLTLSGWEYEIARLRRDFLTFQDKVSDVVELVKRDVTSLRNSINRGGGNSIVNDIMRLKRSGVKAEDIKTMMCALGHGKTEKSEDIPDNVRSLSEANIDSNPKGKGVYSVEELWRVKEHGESKQC